MTAFARKEHRDSEGALVWELRSVNHRYLEVTVRLPEEFRILEPKIRELAAKRLGRGKVDCNLRFEQGAGSVAGVSVNKDLARKIIDAVGHVDQLLHESKPPTSMEILRWPGVLEVEKPDLSPMQQRAKDLLDEALGSLVESRQREGERLAELITQRCSAMGEQVAAAKERMPLVLAGIRERLRERLAELAQELDQTRLEQEMALLAQRLDVDEEMDRLATHLDEVLSVLKRDEPVGRRLDFLMQELNREANTLSSKSSDVELTRIAVEMKVLIEQMREQVQNIE
jgi:uncharacterized protein (TIGR00255 family)